MIYQVGDIQYIQNDDPIFNGLESAMNEAVKRSRKDVKSVMADRFIGVWTGPNEGGELIAIVYQGEVFRK